MEVSGTGGTRISILVQATQLAGGKSGAAGGQAAGGAGKAPAAGGGSASQTTSYDKKDANKDGVVSALEELTYDMKHPVATDKPVLDVRA